MCPGMGIKIFKDRLMKDVCSVGVIEKIRHEGCARPAKSQDEEELPLLGPCLKFMLGDPES